MKVSNNTKPSIAGIENSKVGKAKEDAKSDGLKDLDSVNGDSSVEISSRAQLMNKAKTIASDQSVNEEKVERLQKMIDSGSYSIDSASIADRIVDEHMLMGE